MTTIIYIQGYVKGKDDRGREKTEEIGYRREGIGKRREKREKRKETMGEEKKYSYGKINHFTDIEAWKLARKLRMEIYANIKVLPPEERFDLGSQM